MPTRTLIIHTLLTRAPMPLQRAWMPQDKGAETNHGGFASLQLGRLLLLRRIVLWEEVCEGRTRSKTPPGHATASPSLLMPLWKALLPQIE